MPSPRVAIIGGGITGLAAAHHLSMIEEPPEVIVIEAASRLGGKLTLAEVGGLTIDVGAESVLSRRPEAVDLIRAVGLADDLVHPARSGAGILVGDSLRRLPSQQLLGIPYDWSGLAASGVLSRVGLTRARLDGFLPRTTIEHDISVGALVRSRMGSQVLDRLVEPLLGGVYAGRADSISLAASLPGLIDRLRVTSSLALAARQHRGPARSAEAVFASIQGGLGRLPAAVAAASGAAIQFDSPVAAIARTERGWTIEVAGGSPIQADAVVIALPASAAASVLRDPLPATSKLLGDIGFATVALVSYVFNDADIGPRPSGTGFLCPPAFNRLVKAVTFASDKWQWLSGASAGRVVIRASVGRFGNDDASRQSADLSGAVLQELRPLLRISGPPIATDVTRWPGGLPQYEVGHLQTVERIRTSIDDAPSLALCGASLDGVGVASCIASGQRAATRVSQFLRLRRQ